MQRVQKAMLVAIVLLLLSCAAHAPMQIKAEVSKARICQVECVAEGISDKNVEATSKRCLEKAKERCQAMLCSGEIACVLLPKEETQAREGKRVVFRKTIERPKLFKDE